MVGPWHESFGLRSRGGKPEPGVQAAEGQEETSFQGL